MAGVDHITRDEIAGLVTQARNTGQDEKAYVKAQLILKYPGIENTTIRRGANVFNALDYLVEDTESYATGS